MPGKNKNRRHSPRLLSRQSKKSQSSEAAAVNLAIKAALKEVSLHDPDLAKAFKSEIKGKKLLRYKPS